MSEVTRPYRDPASLRSPGDEATTLRVAVLVHHYGRSVSRVAMECGLGEDVVRRIQADDSLRDRVRSMQLPAHGSTDELRIERGATCD